MRQLLIEGAVAAGIGLFIGLEREHRETAEGSALREPLLGVRSFALLSLLGWTTALLSATWAWLPALAMLSVGALLTAQFLRSTVVTGDFGLTTELGALLTFLLGVLVHTDLRLAATLALAVTLLLFIRPWVRIVVPRILRRELMGTLQFLIVLAVVLPLLPEEPLDPWGVLPPRKIGLFVVMVAGIDFVGYVLARLLGRSRSAALTGLVGGLVSSTAVTVTMARQAAASPALAAPSRLGVLVANTVMTGRVLVIAAIVNREVALALIAPLGIMGAILLACSVATWRRVRAMPSHARHKSPAPAARDGGEDEGGLPVSNPLTLLPALKWGLLLCVVLVVARVANDLLGSAGLLATAAASGLADVDPITLAASRQAALGAVPAGTAALAVVIAVLSNMLVKSGIAFVAGRAAFGRPVALVLCGAAMSGVTAALLLR